tara:strand:- start:97 stop:519 length:423 start_codon:yes stop_codon:yes gene_type:complete
MTNISFPENIAPSSRSFKAGEYPQSVFEAQNGAKSIIRYGNKQVNATLTLGFTNISDENVMSILNNYKNVNSEWNYITFSKTKGLQGTDHNGLLNTVISGTSNYMESSLRWRYSAPPSITSVQPGINNVTCSFVACLDGD